MLERYSRPQMVQIWEPQAKFQRWLDIEVAACEAWAKLKKIPAQDLKNIQKKARFDIARINAIEAITKHDVIAFVSCVAEFVGPSGRFLHMGLTSSDVLDTCLAMQLRDAGRILLQDLDQLLKVLKRKAHQYKETVQVGRSHGIHAEPITFGLKLAIWYDEMKRNRERLALAIEQIAFGKCSGAVGTFAHAPPAIERYVMKKLGLKPAPASSQIVQRDRHAFYFATLAVIAGTVDKIAVEVRHLQRTEVLEAEEYFSPGQKGSSAMPHKRNPILSENLSGLARLIRGYAVSAFENQPLWHERDISHSSVERVIGPDATVTLDFMLGRLTHLLENLVVYPKRMRENLEKLGGLVHSQQVLLALVESGMKREDAYAVVQRLAMRVWETRENYAALLKQDEQVRKHLSPKEIDAIFDLKHHLKHVGHIFKRVFGA
ncbi:adenylosuccinate lyase [Deltaproteobacteria bacterium PRO3]|nr:adenylosuccinate lyase [Deltaproteobacteria bacterium PRO3]